MGAAEILAEAFEYPHALDWTQTSRYGPKEFFGRKPEDELPEDLFKGRIPEGIGDAFDYELKAHHRLPAPALTVNFGQQYIPTHPLSVHQYLKLLFGKVTWPDNPMGHAEGFEHLKEAWVLFEREFYIAYGNTKRPCVRLYSQNMGICRLGRIGERNTFTEHGNRLMEGLLSQKEKITAVPGMEEDGHPLLVQLLDMIEEKYLAKELEPV
jgi:hypothetical protein